MALPLPSTGIVISKRNPEAERLTPEQIEKFMKKHGISEKELSEIFGVTLPAVKYWITGQREFSITNSRLVRLFEKYPQLIREF